MGKTKVELISSDKRPSRRWCQEEQSLYFLGAFNDLPSAATKNNTLISNSATAYIGRAEVGIIFQRELWGLYGTDKDLGALLQRFIPGKPPQKLVAICGAIKQGVKKDSLDGLWEEFDKYYEKKISWEQLLDNTGLDPSSWSWRSSVFPNLSLIHI